MKFLSSCPICQSKKIIRWGIQKLFHKPKPASMREAEDQYLLDRLQKKHLVRSLYFCTSCTFVFQNPTYTEQELQSLYNSNGVQSAEYYKAAGRSTDQLWDSPRARQNNEFRKAFYSAVIRSLGAGSVLDYGGGDGRNVTHPRLQNTIRYVYDFAEDKEYYCDGVIPLKSLGNLRNVDFILCTHVLEHLSDPLATFNTFRGMIAARGHLLIEVPFDFTERILTRRPGAVWHVNHFTRKTILELAERSGWHCMLVRMKPMPYSNRFQLCLIAVLAPKIRGGSYPKPLSTGWLMVDMFRCLYSRAERIFH